MNKRKHFHLLLLATAGLLFAQTGAYAFYNPTQGRWLSRDPAGEEACVALYGFLQNDAMRRLDYHGLWTVLTGPTGDFVIVQDPPQYNTVVCSNGHPAIVLHPSTLLHCPPIQDCIKRHEQHHVDDINAENPSICANVPNGTFVVGSSGQQRKESEIDAYGHELNCLRDAIRDGFSLVRIGKPCPCPLATLSTFKNTIIERLREALI